MENIPHNPPNAEIQSPDGKDKFDLPPLRSAIRRRGLARRAMISTGPIETETAPVGETLADLVVIGSGQLFTRETAEIIRRTVWSYGLRPAQIPDRVGRGTATGVGSLPVRNE